MPPLFHRVAFTALCLTGLIARAELTPLIDIAQLDHDRVLRAADRYLADQPLTVTAAHCDRSAGGPHDFFSEGDYWWPDPANPAGPYIQRDGMTNPDNFVAHRHAMIRFAIHVASLTSAYRLTNDPKYADHAIAHLRAWFADEATRMNPNLDYAQAIKGRYIGRGTGIIDTIHLVEVARSAQILAQARQLKGNDVAATKRWFADYIHWLTTSKNGGDEMKAANNHATCFFMQLAAFASFTDDQQTLAACRKRFKEVLLEKQLAADGSFPLELKRTKPYGYSLFNLDAMAALCRILSTPQDNLWDFHTSGGQSMRDAIDFMYPYIRDKSKWPHKPDVMFWEFWPVRSPALLFAGLAYREPKYLEVWKTLEPNPTNDEVLRNLPIREPVLWVDLAAPATTAPASAPTTNLVIQSAVFGDLDNDKTIDVTKKVAAIVKDDNLWVKASVANFGDPAPNAPKKLKVGYTYYGLYHSKTVSEGEALDISTRLLIRKAVYGDLPNGPFADVTADVAALVEKNTLTVNASNEIFGDSAPNKVKRLRVDYSFDSKAKSKTVGENETLTVSSKGE